MFSLARSSLCASLAVVGLAGTSAGQSTGSPLSHFEDAAPVPAGAIRLVIANVWTRYDQRFTVDSTEPLNAGLFADSLGVAQLPLLQGTEAGLRTLAADPALRLSFGALRVGGNARIVTTPISLEYGVTRRLSVGLVVPVVETRRVAQAAVAGGIVNANMGFIPVGVRATAAGQNLGVATAYQRAADSLGRLVALCPANPAAPDCAAVNANPSDAAAARLLAQSYAQAAGALGTTASTAIVAPREKSALAKTLDARRQQLNARLQQYLGSSFTVPAATVYLAVSDFSYRDLQGDRATGAIGLLGGPLGGGLDSIHTTERIGFGDIALGARFLVFDHFQRDSTPPRIQTRLMLGAAVRFATSLADSAQNLVDIPTGDGAGVGINSVMDVIVGHVGATIGVRYDKPFARTVTASLVGDPEAAYPYPLFGPRTRTAGTVFGLDLTPRLFLSPTLAIDALYGFERVGATTYGATEATPTPCPACVVPDAVPFVVGTTRTAQRLGFGFRYSTVDAYALHRAPYPVEISFARLNTITGDAGVLKQTRDQIQVRLFYQILRRR